MAFLCLITCNAQLKWEGVWKDHKWTTDTHLKNAPKFYCFTYLSCVHTWLFENLTSPSPRSMNLFSLMDPFSRSMNLFSLMDPSFYIFV